MSSSETSEHHAHILQPDAEPRKYMVCVDGSRCSSWAFNYCVRQMRVDIDELYLIAVADEIDNAAISAPYMNQEFFDAAQKKEDEVAKQYLRPLWREAKRLKVRSVLCGCV
jgi:hypothetical protein